MKDFLHNCKFNTGNKSLDRKADENAYTTKHGTVVAKTIDHDLQDATRTRYLVATYLGGLYDPNGGYSNRESKLTLDFKSVSQTTFNHYTSYLANNKRVSLIAAERSFLNGN